MNNKPNRFYLLALLSFFIADLLIECSTPLAYLFIFIMSILVLIGRLSK